jgi:hypothetical protein
MPLGLLPLNFISSVLFGILSSPMRMTWPYPFSLFLSISYFMSSTFSCSSLLSQIHKFFISLDTKYCSILV